MGRLARRSTCVGPWLGLARADVLSQAGNVPLPLPQRLAHLTALWRRASSPWRLNVFLAALTATLAVGAHVARAGTWHARAGVALVVLGLITVTAVASAIMHRRERDPIRLAKLLADKADPLLGDRAARAVRLVRSADAGTDSVSSALARLHLEKLLSNVLPEHLWESGRREAARGRRVVLALAVVALAAVVWGPWKVIEGMDVLLAHSGRAPVPLSWVDTVFCSTRPPRYLGLQDDLVMGFVPTRQPRGTLLTLHARQLHEGRQLVLTDGQMEVPFVDDGRGAVVAHWTVGDSAELRVAARFGDVLIEQRDVLHMAAIEDYTPDVTLDGAPRTVALLDVTEVALAYEAIDDHGLTQIDLVLRAGDEESRRVLARHDGQTVYDRGSTVLRNDDVFLRRSHVPVGVTIEARDNDPVSGPKWGKSKVLLIVPPAVGEPEVRRYAELASLRDEAVDVLAARLTTHFSWTPSERAAWSGKEIAAAETFHKKVTDGVNAKYAGLDVPRRVRTLFVGQADRLLAATKATCPGDASAKGCSERFEALGKRAGNVVLAFDIGVRSLATRDARDIARRLADVADDASEGARLSRLPEQERGKARLEAALTVLQGGAKSLSVLDDLGADLGEVTSIGVRRIERAWQRGDSQHAELAAHDLAERLRRPFPSFSGGGGRRGTEAGGSVSLDDQSAGAGEDAQEALEQHGSELDELTRDHATAMDELSKELAEALRTADLEGLQDAAREHAQRVRESVANLPSEATDTSSLEGTAAVVRENAERMADAMDRMGMSDAEQAGRNALRAADQAGAVAKRERSLFGDESRLGGQVDTAQGEIDRELAWVRDQMERMRRAAAEQTKGDLGNAAREEDTMAERAQHLANRGREGAAPLPDATIAKLEQAHRAMRDAARALRESDTRRGVDKQREAQRMLETAREAQNTRGDKDEASSEHASCEDRASDHGDGRDISEGHVDIPGADTFRGPEEFRRRVVDGLSDAPDPRLRDAIRRYAEGLLR